MCTFGLRYKTLNKASVTTCSERVDELTMESNQVDQKLYR